jgi:hypothetical protein
MTNVFQIAVVGILVFLPVYFLPAEIAFAVHHPKTKRILALNLVAGWTAVGWIMALVLALRGHPGVEPKPIN